MSDEKHQQASRHQSTSEPNKTSMFSVGRAVVNIPPEDPRMKYKPQILPCGVDYRLDSSLPERVLLWSASLLMLVACLALSIMLVCLTVSVATKTANGENVLSSTFEGEQRAP